MNSRGFLAVTAFSIACFATGAQADPTLDFSPAVGVYFYSADGIDDLGLEYQYLYYSSYDSYSSTGDGNAYASGGYAYANVGVRGTANASTFMEAIYTIENVSGISRSYDVLYGYGINGYVSTARGTTHEDWSVGIEDSDLPLSHLDGSFESQNHDCAGPGGDYYSCFNFYDSNDWYDYVTLEPNVVYTTHVIVSVNLAATAAPEPPSWLLLISGLIGCIFLGRLTLRRPTRGLSTV